MITWGPCDHPVRPDGCRVCALLDRTDGEGVLRDVVDPRWSWRQGEANAWSGGDVGSHLTLEQMRAIELGWRRGCNRGTRFETEAGLAIVLRDADDRRNRGAAGEVQRITERLCPPQSRRPTWLINWMLAQRQKQTDNGTRSPRSTGRPGPGRPRDHERSAPTRRRSVDDRL